MTATKYIATMTILFDNGVNRDYTVYDGYTDHLADDALFDIKSYIDNSLAQHTMVRFTTVDGDSVMINPAKIVTVNSSVTTTD